MTGGDDALAMMWVRLDDEMSRVRDGSNSPERNTCPVAVAGAVDALYDLWLYWRGTAGLHQRAQLNRARGDADGETAAALCLIRSAKAHGQKAPGESREYIVYGGFSQLTTKGSAIVLSHTHSCWWKPFVHPDPKLAEVNRWYATHVANREALPPLDAAVRWLRALPELS